MDKGQVELLRKIFIYGTAVLVFLIVVAALYTQLNKARLNISAPDNYTVFVSRSSDQELIEIGSGDQSYSSSEAGPVYVVARSDGDTFYGYADLQNRQTKEVVVSQNTPSLPITAKRVGAPVVNGYIENDILYGTSEKTKSIAVNELGDTTRDRFFFGYPAMNRIEWLDKDNFVYESTSNEVGFSFQGQNGNRDTVELDEYSSVRLGSEGDAIAYKNNQMTYLKKVQFAYTPPDSFSLPGQIVEATLHDGQIIALVGTGDEEGDNSLVVLGLDGAEEKRINIASSSLPAGDLLDILISGDRYVLVFTGGVLEVTGDNVEEFLTYVSVKDAIVVDSRPLVLLEDGLFELKENGLIKSSDLVEGSVGSRDSIFGGDGELYFSSRGAEDNYLYSASLSSLE